MWSPKWNLTTISKLPYGKEDRGAVSLFLNIYFAISTAFHNIIRSEINGDLYVCPVLLLFASFFFHVLPHFSARKLLNSSLMLLTVRHFMR